MLCPPTEIHVKRKATDDPVELLHVHNEVNGGRPIKQYVFKRQRTSTDNNAQTPLASPKFDVPATTISFTGTRDSVSTPQIAVTQAGDDLRNRDIQSLGQVGTISNEFQGTVELSRNVPTRQYDEALPSERSDVRTSSGPRRFHLSRISPPQSSGGLLLNRLRGPRLAPAVFIERRHPLELTQAKVSYPNGGGVVVEHGPELETQEINLGLQSNNTGIRRQEVQLSKSVPSNNVSATVAAETHAYPIQQPSNNMAEPLRAAPTVNASFIRVRQPSSFKPRIPALRYHERHPETATATSHGPAADADEGMTDVIDTDKDELGYVIDTYIRMPAEMVESHEEKDVGILVLDTQPDVDEFYNENSDSDSEPFDDDEDENAENHPSTDYPDEDEAGFDDEYGQDSYRHYPKRKNIDDEEFDQDAFCSDEDEEEDSRYPWSRKPWMSGQAFHENEEDEEY